MVFAVPCLLALFAAMILMRGLAAAQGTVLYWGSSGNEVSSVQQRLSQWGYYKGPVDGVYGYETFRAVQNFQRNNGLPQDGVVGRATREALGLSSPDNAPAVSRGAATDRGDTTLLARVIEGEAADESLQGKNSCRSGNFEPDQERCFPRTISGVIFQDHAFESISNGQAYRSPEPAKAFRRPNGPERYDPPAARSFSGTRMLCKLLDLVKKLLRKSATMFLRVKEGFFLRRWIIPVVIGLLALAAAGSWVITSAWPTVTWKTF